ncbi:MAG: hypothetical protein HY763_05735 [Planctomycetes bacterium]|nr:hypothetical protein [Planctomycetota bacterium]
MMRISPLLRGGWLSGRLAAWALVSFFTVAGARADQAAVATPAARTAAAQILALNARWGVEVVAVRLAAASRMVDFRYRVTDPEKARPLFGRKTKSELLDQASGRKLTVASTAKTGPLRSSNDPIAGRTYFMFFGNPGLVKAGSAVSVSIGEFTAANLVVE